MDDEDIAGLRGFEVGGTITTGVRIYCMRCGDWFADWTSRELFPRVAEMVEVCEAHVCEEVT